MGTPADAPGTSSGSGHPRFPWVILLGCVVGCFLIFGSALRFGFVYDDLPTVRDNDLLKHPANLLKLFASPYSYPEIGLYRPVTMASFLVNYGLFGALPWSFHCVNIFLHALTTWLVFMLIRRMTQNDRLAVWTTVWFLVLPIHTEAVVGIVGRAELLALAGSLTLYLLLIDRRGEARPVSIPRAMAAMLVFLSALLSKEHAVAALPIYLCWIALAARSSQRSVIQEMWNNRRAIVWLTLALMIYCCARVLVLGPYSFRNAAATVVENPLGFVPSYARILTACKIVTLYGEKCFWPFRLSSDYSYNQIPIVTRAGSDVRTMIGCAVLAGLGWCLARPFLNRKSRAAPEDAHWGLASALVLWPFLPASNLWFPGGTIMGERLLYAPSVGLCVMLAWAGCQATAHQHGGPHERIRRTGRVLGWLAMAGLLAWYSARSVQRTGAWKDERTLFLDAAEASPHSVLARSNSAAVYLLEENFRQAEAELQAADQIYPFYPPAMNNLGLLYRRQQRPDLAERQFIKTIHIDPGYLNAYENLALLYVEQGRLADAKRVLMRRYGNQEERVAYHLQQLENQRFLSALTRIRTELTVRSESIETVDQALEKSP